MKFNNQKGATLLLLIVTMTLMAVLSAGIYTMTTSSSFSQLLASKDFNAYQLSKAGMRYAAFVGSDDASNPAGNYCMDGNQCFTISVVDSGTQRQFTASGYVGEGSFLASNRLLAYNMTKLIGGGGGSEGYDNPENDDTPPTIDYDKHMDDFPLGEVGKTKSDEGAITVDRDNNRIIIGDLSQNQFGSAVYGGDTYLGNCVGGKCEFGTGVNAYFEFRMREDYSANSTSSADGFTFALFSGITNEINATGGVPADVVSSLGETVGYSGPGTDRYVAGGTLAYAGPGTGPGWQPPKMAIEFDTYPNTGSHTITQPGSRRDPSPFRNHLALVLWGENHAVPYRTDSNINNAVGLRCTPNDEFVRSLYRSILGRRAEAAGLRGHILGLNSHTSTATQNTARANLIKAFFNSPEYAGRGRTNAQFRNDLCRAAIGGVDCSEWPLGAMPVWFNYWPFSENRSDYVNSVLNSSRYNNNVSDCGAYSSSTYDGKSIGVYNCNNVARRRVSTHLDCSGPPTGKYNRDTFDDNVHFEGGAEESFWEIPLSPANSVDGSGYYVPSSGNNYGDRRCASSSNTCRWFEDGHKHSFRIEVDRATAPHACATAGLSGNCYNYTVKGWIDCDGKNPSTCTATQKANIKNVKTAFTDVSPQINKTVELHEYWHTRFEKFIFGWTGASGGSVQEVTLTDFNQSFRTPQPCPFVTTITPVPLSEATAGSLYSQTMAATPTNAKPYTWSISRGALPPGLTLNASTGVLSGTPTTAGVYNFTIKATNICTRWRTQSYSLIVNGGCQGGEISTSGGKTYHTFRSSGALTCYGAISADVLLVGGGGAGGGRHGGGGGAGGVVSASEYSIATGSPITVTVGTGGLPTQTNPNEQSVGGKGEDSVFGTLRALGGGGGGSYTASVPTGGGSGGGGGGGRNTTAGLANQPGSPSGGWGNAGGNGAPLVAGLNNTGGGGGGGAGGVGQPAAGYDIGGAGGAGLEISMGGVNYVVGGGGGGGGLNGGGAGGLGGGGNGGNATGTAGAPNTGGGGGGVRSPVGATNAQGKEGGSGIVVIRY